jgi:hypothetical protein
MLAAIGLQYGLMHISPTDDYRLPTQFRIAQQLDGCIKCIHIEMGDQAGCSGHRN